jgi:hypothetical protein
MNRLHPIFRYAAIVPTVAFAERMKILNIGAAGYETIFQPSELNTRLNNWSLMSDFPGGFEQCQEQ